MDQVRPLACGIGVDIVGYSRLTADDESGILARLKSLRSEVIDPTVAGS